MLFHIELYKQKRWKTFITLFLLYEQSMNILMAFFAWKHFYKKAVSVSDFFQVQGSSDEAEIISNSKSMSHVTCHWCLIIKIIFAFGCKCVDNTFGLVIFFEDFSQYIKHRSRDRQPSPTFLRPKNISSSYEIAVGLFYLIPSALVNTE